MSETSPSTSSWVTHPWVAEGESNVRFGIFNGPLADWSTLLQWVQTAEALGFDSFWVGDHTILFPIDCWTALAALAVQTTRIRLGSLVSCIYYRPPALLARMAADVDRLSNGRLLLGLGVGDYAKEFEQVGLPYPSLRERQAALTETIEIVRGLWGDVPFTFRGTHFQVADAMVRPGPLQQPHVPILIAGGGERVTLQQVARYADMSNFGPSGVTGSAWSLDDIRRKFEVLRQHCNRLGRPYESVLRSHLAPLILGETDTAVQAKLDALPKHPPLTEMERAPGMPRQLSTYYAVPTLEHIPLVIIAGTPREVTTYYRALIEAGVQYFIAQCRNDVETMRLLAEQVMPEFASA